MSSRSLSALFKRKSKSRSPASPTESAHSQDVESRPASPDPRPSNDSMETLVNSQRPQSQPTRGRAPQRQVTPHDPERGFGALSGTYGLNDWLAGPPPVNPPGHKSKKAEKAEKAARKAASRETSTSAGASASPPSASPGASSSRSPLSAGRSLSRLAPGYWSRGADESQGSLHRTSSPVPSYASTDTLQVPHPSTAPPAPSPSTSDPNRADEGDAFGRLASTYGYGALVGPPPVETPRSRSKKPDASRER